MFSSSLTSHIFLFLTCVMWLALVYVPWDTSIPPPSLLPATLQPPSLCLEQGGGRFKDGVWVMALPHQHFLQLLAGRNSLCRKVSESLKSPKGLVRSGSRYKLSIMIVFFVTGDSQEVKAFSAAVRQARRCKGESRKALKQSNHRVESQGKLHDDYWGRPPSDHKDTKKKTCWQ